MERARLTITAFKTRDEKVELIRNIAGQVAGARDAQTWTYRGLTLRKSETGRSRGGSVIVVEGPDGHEYTEFDMKANETHEILGTLDEIRDVAIGSGKSEVSA